MPKMKRHYVFLMLEILLSVERRLMVSKLSLRQNMLDEANTFLDLCNFEHALSSPLYERRMDVTHAIKHFGSYSHTKEELAFGAKVAWRNSSRCIGRLHWQSLLVRDMRHLLTYEDIFDALVEHIQLATNGGKIKSIITIFAPQRPGEPGIRIWNPQLIRYAGYKQANGAIIGDPLHTKLTEVALRMGWKGGKKTSFDILPVILQLPGQSPKLFELPNDVVKEVHLTHPDFAWFDDLHLKWYALPLISDMRLEIGGISYTAAPFSGWYMGTEIGARNLADNKRYNMLPVIAKRMGLDIGSERNLWKDQAMIELNKAVLHSFATQGVTIVDHHTASRQFIVHEENEVRAGRSISGDWGWLVPPVSGSLSPIFHHRYVDFASKPNFFYQPSAYSA